MNMAEKLRYNAYGGDDDGYYNLTSDEMLEAADLIEENEKLKISLHECRRVLTDRGVQYYNHDKEHYEDADTLLDPIIGTIPAQEHKHNA